MVASAWDISSLNFLDKFDSIKYQKIASAMIVDDNFSKEVADEKNIHLFPLACHKRMILIMQ